jgi:hypothetical protein
MHRGLLWPTFEPIFLYWLASWVFVPINRKPGHDLQGELNVIFNEMDEIFAGLEPPASSSFHEKSLIKENRKPCF